MHSEKSSPMERPPSSIFLTRNTLPAIRCIFFADFDNHIGRRIEYQIPENFIDQNLFDSIQHYVIPKKELWNRLVKCYLKQYKIIGYPVGIEDKKYFRNTYQFNLCFVVDNVGHADSLYEPVVEKLAHYLKDLETDMEFLYNSTSKPQLVDIMGKLLEDLNCKQSCSIDLTGGMRIHVKVMPFPCEPPQVNLHDVPVFKEVLRGRNIEDVLAELYSEHHSGAFDVTSRQIVSCIDGLNSVAKIADVASVDVSVVQRIVQNMAYYGRISLLPVFQYSSRYSLTSKFEEVTYNPAVQEECLNFIALSSHSSPSPVPKWSQVLRLYCSLQPGLCMRDWFIRTSPRLMGIDERKFVQFGVAKGFLRKLSGYPVSLDSPQEFGGLKNFEKICLEDGVSQADLQKRCDSDANIVVLWK